MGYFFRMLGLPYKRLIKQTEIMKTLALIVLLLFFAPCLSAQAPLQATETEALFSVSVTDPENLPLQGEQILFETLSGKSFRGISDKQGTFKILLPEGETYNIVIKGIGESQDYHKMELPAVEGIYNEAEIQIQIAHSETVFRLDDVHFDTGKSTLRPGSYPALDELVEILKLKPKMVIEVAGHTDNVGDDASNRKLSQNRAEVVRAYLLKKGIDPGRINAQGYGESEPIASNVSANGRQQNRRTEVRILAQ